MSELPPIRVMLVDDHAVVLLSELDAARRQTLLATLAGVQQAIITTTDWEDFAPDFLAQAQRLHVQQGTVLPARDV
jgi:DNA replication and repair protein RecF